MRALLLIALLLSGCIGLPDGAADFGDEVTIRYVATDLDGMPIVWSLDSVAMAQTTEPSYVGASLQGQVRARLGTIPAELSGFFTAEANGFIPPVPKADFDAAVVAAGLVERFSLSKTFVLGSGDSGLGFDAERGMIGMLVNDTRTITSKDDASRDYSQVISRARWLGEPEPLATTIEQATFEQNLGAPTVGQVFAYNNLFQAEVVSFDGDNVEARLLIDETTSFDASIVGGTVMARIIGDAYRFELVLAEGDTFALQSTPFQPAPLELPDGSYRSIGTEGDDVLWAFTPVPTALVNVPAVFHVELTDRTQGDLVADPEHYGDRMSPVLPDVHMVSEHDHEEAETGQDDGHDDGHTH